MQMGAFQGTAPRNVRFTDFVCGANRMRIRYLFRLACLFRQGLQSPAKKTVTQVLFDVAAVWSET